MVDSTFDPPGDGFGVFGPLPPGEKRQVEIPLQEVFRHVNPQHLKRRNDQLAAEVKDLKEGLSALEERARNDLGMVGASETFYQVADAASAGPPNTLPNAQPQAPGIKRISR